MKKIMFSLLLVIMAVAPISRAIENSELASDPVKQLKGDKIYLQVSGARGYAMFRTSVPGGWLIMRYKHHHPYKSSDINTSGFTFVPDYNHEWLLEPGNELKGEIYSLKKLGISSGMMYRAAVPGGWLVFHYNEGYFFNNATNGIIYIADPNQEWVID